MPAIEKADKQLIRRKKFQEVSVPLNKTKIELIANTPKDLLNRTIKLDMTRQLKGKSVELVLKIILENDKPVAMPRKITLMPYFIRRMIRKRISYVEDSFVSPSQESMITIKPFLITKRRVSRAIRKTLRNKAKNWIIDYVSQKKDNEIFSELLSTKLQRSLSSTLKKTYPLSLCEIRVLEIGRQLKIEEVPKIKEKKVEIVPVKEEEEYIDQMKEIEDEKIRNAEKEIKETQEKALELANEKEENTESTKESIEEKIVEKETDSNKVNKKKKK